MNYVGDTMFCLGFLKTQHYTSLKKLVHRCSHMTAMTVQDIYIRKSYVILALIYHFSNFIRDIYKNCLFANNSSCYSPYTMCNAGNELSCVN